jgi:hypothetical protein
VGREQLWLMAVHLRVDPLGNRVHEREKVLESVLVDSSHSVEQLEALEDVSLRELLLIR